ncbi:ring-opening amidohydrolase [Bacillus sp. JCM 19034]|uniref:ring-opening amidohydrolase n=1 Tax=Bacillus sp. JCM 19034 TaxID=1481928 RepID=UPI000784CD54|nr:ring-opening amidohydrolase [Bacillus sp. JCM 19034]
MNYQLIRCDMEHPGDVSSLQSLLEKGKVKAETIKAIIAQTEGDGYARGYATLAFQNLLSSYLEISKEDVFEQIPMMMIGKTGGLMTPHYTLFIKEDDCIEWVSEEKRFAFGVASTPILKRNEIGTVKQVDYVTEAVIQAMKEANIDSFEDVKCVEVKCPWGDGGSLAKAASALGSAIALKEIERHKVSQDSLNQDHSLFSLKTSVSAGQEQVSARVIVMGNSRSSSSDLYIGAGVMEDALDLNGLREAFVNAGLEGGTPLSDEERERVVQVFVNAGADALSTVRGKRHTMHTDALAMHSGILAKAVANAVVGSFVGETRILCSAGSEHQGPQGSNLVSPVIRVKGDAL